MAPLETKIIFQGPSVHFHDYERKRMFLIFSRKQVVRMDKDMSVFNMFFFSFRWFKTFLIFAANFRGKFEPMVEIAGNASCQKNNIYFAKTHKTHLNESKFFFFGTFKILKDQLEMQFSTPKNDKKFETPLGVEVLWWGGGCEKMVT